MNWIVRRGQQAKTVGPTKTGKPRTARTALNIAFPAPSGWHWEDDGRGNNPYVSVTVEDSTGHIVLSVGLIDNG